jgi:hypothetical protein
VRKAILTLIMSGLALAGFAGEAQASPVTTYCPGTPALTDREFSVTVDVSNPLTEAPICRWSAPGNIGGNDDYINDTLDGTNFWTTLDKSDDVITGLFPLAMTVTGGGTLGGTFEFDSNLWDLYSRIIIAFKSGEGQLNPDWAAFELRGGVTEGDWAITSGNQSLSHVSLYGADFRAVQQQVPVPEPASLALLGLGLAVGARRLRKRN